MARPRDPERLQKFSRWLRNIAPSKGFDSQRQLAIKAGINEATVSRIWNATQLPDEITLVKFAQALGVDIPEALTQAGYPVELVTTTTEPLDPTIERIGYTDPSPAAVKIAEAVDSDPELLEFWKELSRREDLQLLFRQTKSMTPETIRKVMRIIKAIEDEEANED